ncbi:hypothetical protein CCACVL1_06800 [Corchorus capsularis]|uniref:Uncharacterized protein n=1 Tax=Corchorus capsularis TaxID=210143 RepID=A0A1R3JCL9_COCAP|nr:hypothetical protein CCACVL1_06800 [Corchorus capsularis]
MEERELSEEATEGVQEEEEIASMEEEPGKKKSEMKETEK